MVARSGKTAADTTLSTDTVRLLSYTEGRCVGLGTDGFVRSDTRTALRHFVEVNRYQMVVAARASLARRALSASTSSNDPSTNTLSTRNVRRRGEPRNSRVARRSRVGLRSPNPRRARQRSRFTVIAELVQVSWLNTGWRHGVARRGSPRQWPLAGRFRGDTEWQLLAASRHSLTGPLATLRFTGV